MTFKKSLSVLMIFSQLGMSAVAFSSDSGQPQAKNAAEMNLLGDLVALQSKGDSATYIDQQNALLSAYFTSESPEGMPERLIDAAAQMNMISANRAAALQAQVQAGLATASSQSAMQSNIETILATSQDGAQFSGRYVATCAGAAALIAGAGGVAYWGYVRGTKNENSGWGGFGVEVLFFSMAAIGGVGLLACSAGYSL